MILSNFCGHLGIYELYCTFLFFQNNLLIKNFYYELIFQNGQEPDKGGFYSERADEFVISPNTRTKLFS